MMIDTIDHGRSCALGPAWELALDFITSLGPTSEEGEFELDGRDVFARVMSYRTKEAEEAVLESHHEYVDIQAVLEGGEGLAWCSTLGLTVTTPYNPETDVVFYRPPAHMPARVDMLPGIVVVLYPRDAHMPSLRLAGQPETVRKVVVKVRASLVLGKT